MKSERSTDDSAEHQLDTGDLGSHLAVNPNEIVTSGEASPMHKFGTTLASFAKSAALEVKLSSQIAVLKTRIENAKQIELRKAHYALGRKLYEARILLSMQEEIEELERQIAEKGERAVIEENETKGAMLKRVGKNAAKNAESELLSLKLKQSLTHLGELARGAHQETSFPGAETEMESCSAVESKIRNCEEQISSLGASRKKATPNALPNNAPQSIRENVMDLQDHSAKSAEDSERGASIDHPEYYEEAQSNISKENLPVASAPVAPAVSKGEKFQPSTNADRFADKLPGTAFSLPRLIPLFVCCLVFGWIVGFWLMPNLGFIRNSFIAQAIPVAMLAIPSLILAIFGICFFVRPLRFPRKEAIGVLFFTMLFGLAGLLFFQFIADYTLSHLPNHPRGKFGLIVYIVAAIGGAYRSLESSNIFERLFGFIFGVGFCEETTKLLPLFFFALVGRTRSNFIDFRGFLIVGYFSGLGFGIGEALYNYAPWSGNPNPLVGSNVLRWFALVPSHAIWTVTDAAFLWLLAPKISQAKNHYAAFGFCALTVLAVAVVHGIYDVLCGIPFMGILFSGGSIFLMYFVVVWVAKKTGESRTIQEHEENTFSGIVGWLKNSKAGHMRFGRIYVICSILIVSSLVFSKSISEVQGDVNNLDSGEIQSGGSISKNEYYQICYSLGTQFNPGLKRYDLENFVNVYLQEHPEIDRSLYELLITALEDGYLGRPRRF